MNSKQNKIVGVLKVGQTKFLRHITTPKRRLWQAIHRNIEKCPFAVSLKLPTKDTRLSVIDNASNRSTGAIKLMMFCVIKLELSPGCGLSKIYCENG